MLLSPETVDAYNPKVVRGAMGAHFRLPILEAVWAEIADRVRGMNVYLAAADGELTYTEADWTQPSALIVGSEASGASKDAAQLATKRISIPLSREVESLNAAVAASVILFEAKRQRMSATDNRMCNWSHRVSWKLCSSTASSRSNDFSQRPRERAGSIHPLFDDHPLP